MCMVKVEGTGELPRTRRPDRDIDLRHGIALNRQLLHL